MKRLITYFSTPNALSLVIGSTLDRLWSDIDPLKSRKFLSILALLLTIGVGNVWGATSISVNISTYASANSWSNASAYSSISIDANVTATGLTNGNNSKYYSSNTSWRHYEGDGGTITISTSSGTISSVTFTYASGNNGVIKYNSTDETSSGTAISVSGSSVSFTVGHSSGTKTGNVQITAISVTYTPAASKTLSSIAITTQPTKRAYLVGQTFSSTGAVVTATYSDATTATVSATWTPTTGLVSGSNTITASYTEGGVTKTATTTVTGYTVTVQVKDVDGNTLSGVGAPTASATGASITASASGNNYVFKRWVAVTAAGTSFANASNRSTTLTGTPTGNVTIKAEYYKPINITWNAGGSAYTPGTPGTTQVGYGTLMSSLTLPSPAPSTASYCGDKFVGWTTVEDVSQDDDTGLNLFTSVAGNSTAITEDMDFYAVFADYDE